MKKMKRVQLIHSVDKWRLINEHKCTGKPLIDKHIYRY